MNVLDRLIGDVRSVSAGLEDRRAGGGRGYTIADIGLAAFPLFFMGSPSVLAHQRALTRGRLDDTRHWDI
jgi:hypothetical protein